MVEQVSEMALFRNYKPFMLHGTFGSFGVAIVFFKIGLQLIIMHIAEVFNEEHGKHIILINAWVNASTKSIAGLPDCIVNVLLSYFSHSYFLVAVDNSN